MAHTQLKGQVFKRDGVNYLVMEDNDWTAATLRVKSVDARRAVSEMPLENVLESVFRTSPKPQGPLG